MNDARILVAEDNPAGQELLQAYLAETSYEIRTAANGEQTLKLVGEWKPDVILLDVMMPRMSGFEVCKRLRADAATHDIGIIMVTALDQSADIERAVEVGADDFMTKPIDQDDLLLRIKALLTAKRADGDLQRTLDYFRAVEEMSV
jgi:two-component system, OmpR family, alkaline phosphatase synthesis response regulator PhoP